MGCLFFNFQGDMMKSSHLIFTIFCLGLTGCTVTKHWEAIGGSKADAVVTLSYERCEFQTAEVNDQEGLEVAKKRCVAWGYKNAEAFDAAHSYVQSTGFYHTLRVVKQYQCVN
jgi:hypothetical protein